MDVRAAAGALVIVGATSFVMGYYTKSQFDTADKVDAVVATQKQTAKEAQNSLEQSTAIEQRTTASTQQVTTIRAAVAARLKEAAHARPAQADLGQPVHACTWTLDVGTVGLLNAARAGVNPDPALGGDAASQASSGLGAEDLIDNDLQVVEQYRDLATRHDALVDFVQTILRK
jgi:hypothetical protein